MKSGLGKSIKVLKIGEVIKLFTERKKLSKRTDIQYPWCRHCVPYVEREDIIDTVIDHVL